MNRKRKLIVNLTFIAIILLGTLYVNGYFFSREKCIAEIISAISSEKMEEIMCIPDDDNISYTLLAGTDVEDGFVVVTKQVGFLHRFETSYISYTVSYEEKDVEMLSELTTKSGRHMRFLYRINKDVERVKLWSQAEEKIVPYELKWVDDFAVIVSDERIEIHGYYDAMGNEIECIFTE